jgi:membrane protease YdiL (CAAX protease family)
MRLDNCHHVNRASFLKFIGLTFLISWLLWVPVALSGRDINESGLVIPYVLGGFGPSLSGIIMIYWTQKQQGRRDFWRRVIDFKRISAKSYLVIFFVFPFVFSLAIGVAALMGMPLPKFEQLSQMISNPLMLIGVILAGILTGPLAEELGWRGYALDQLQAHSSPLVSSLLLAPVWWAWHLPLFFIKGTTQYNWGIGTLEFWLFAATIVPLTILLNWIYNHNKKSVLAAILTHFMYNFTLGIVYPVPGNILFLQVIFLYLVVIVITSSQLTSQKSMLHDISDLSTF